MVDCGGAALAGVKLQEGKLQAFVASESSVMNTDLCQHTSQAHE